MKKLRFILYSIFSLIFLWGCTEDIMDKINEQDNNGTTSMLANNMLPSILVRTAYETAGATNAWYATVYVEHSTGTWGQSYAADRHQAQENGNISDNAWASAYKVMGDCFEVIKKTDPKTGTEPTNYMARGIGQVMMAYNLGITTDMFGDIPYKDAFGGLNNKHPKFDTQENIYKSIQLLLDDAIVNFGKTVLTEPKFDYIYGQNKDKWIAAAYSLKARYALHLTKRKDPKVAAQEALDFAKKGFKSLKDAFIFRSFSTDANGENPWHQLMYDRSHLSVSTTLYNLMNERKDPRMEWYFEKIKGKIVPAPNGNADQNQGGVYSVSLITDLIPNAPIALMSYHELKFIEAEAKFILADESWTNSLQQAIKASFDYYGQDSFFTDALAKEEISVDMGTYYEDQVLPRLTTGNELKEILTQKYIAFYEYEPIEAYNDYRRTGFPEMKSPANAVTGFINRFPYAQLEVSANGANVPKIDIYKDKIWWAK